MAGVDDRLVAQQYQALTDRQDRPPASIVTKDNLVVSAAVSAVWPPTPGLRFLLPGTAFRCWPKRGADYTQSKTAVNSTE